MKINKKILKGVWEGCKNPPFGWSVCRIHIFEYKGRLEAFMQYNGKGPVDFIYNLGDKNKSFSISELFSDFTNCEDAVEYAKSLIESSW